MPANFPVAQFGAGDIANSIQNINAIITGQQKNERDIFSNQTGRMQAETQQAQESRIAAHQPFEDMITRMQIDIANRRLASELLTSQLAQKKTGLEIKVLEHDVGFYDELEGTLGKDDGIPLQGKASTLGNMTVAAQALGAAATAVIPSISNRTANSRIDLSWNKKPATSVVAKPESGATAAKVKPLSPSEQIDAAIAASNKGAMFEGAGSGNSPTEQINNAIAASNKGAAGTKFGK